MRAAGEEATVASIYQLASAATGGRVRLAPPEFGTAGAYSLLVVAGLALLAVTQLYRRITRPSHGGDTRMSLWIWIRNQWDRAAGLLAVLAGAGALAGGWVGASGTVYPAQQIPFLMSGGLFGIFLLGVGCTAWLSADLRDEWRKLDQLDETLRAAGIVLPETDSNGSPRVLADPAGQPATATSGGRP